MHEQLVARLAAHRSIGAAPHEELVWLATHGALERHAVGDVITAKGTQARNLIILLDGHMVIRVDRDAGSHKVFEWRAGDVGGVVPYSRGATPPGDVVVEEEAELLAIEKELFPAMIRECPSVTATMVHAMVDRARQFKSSEIRDEKLISLGKLAAGLAHELNNPASAAVRSSKMLTTALTSAEQAARHLSTAHLTDAQFAAIEKARVMCSKGAEGAPLSAIERADREDVISNWLTDRNVSDENAVALADAGVPIEALEMLAGTVEGSALEASLHWLASCCQVRALSSEIETAASRISQLVSAVKGFSYMDHAPMPEPVDIRKGINDTLTMLGAKTRTKGINLTVTFADNLPCAHAVGAELNQVWMNLIDNALDAAPASGHVTVNATRELDCVVVRVIDDGPGVPADIRERIFDPFFTTKGVGKGTGLGLDIVKRLLQRHDGEIDLESSEPGRTEFQVRLPVEK